MDARGPVSGLCSGKPASTQRGANQASCGDWQGSDYPDVSDHRHGNHRGRIAEPAARGPARLTQLSAPARPDRHSRSPVATRQRTGWPWPWLMGRISVGFHPVSCARTGDPTRLPITDRVSAAPSVAAPSAAAPSGGRQTRAATGLTGKLVFQAEGGNIQVYDLASGNVRSLTTGADPALSPDGQTVVFWRQDGGEHGLYVIDINGGKERRVLDPSGEAAHPHLESRWPLHRLQPCQRRGDLPRRRVWGLFAGCLPIQSDVPGNPHRSMEPRSS